MRGAIRTGFWAVVVYLSVYLFNFIFVRGSSEEFLSSLVTPFVLSLLKLFGVVYSLGYLFLGIIFYFILGTIFNFLVESMRIFNKKKI